MKVILGTREGFNWEKLYLLQGKIKETTKEFGRNLGQVGANKKISYIKILFAIVF